MLSDVIFGTFFYVLVVVYMNSCLLEPAVPEI